MARSTIDALPPEIRIWLSETLIRKGFQGYDDITEELASKGFKRSRTAVWRWGRKLEKEVRAAQVQHYAGIR